MAFGLKNFSPAQFKMSIYSNEVSAIYIKIKSITNLTVNISVTRFNQTKAIPPALWAAYDYMLQSNFKKAVIFRSVNTAADFLSRVELKFMGKTRLEIHEDIQKTPNGVSTTSSDVADEEKSSSPKQTTRMSQENRLFNQKNNLGKMQTMGSKA